MKFDYCIIGGGIVGLATALKLGERWPEAKIVVLEKEDQVASHQTGHNSGVIHAGVYYEPGSLKAELCRKGAAAITDFCSEHGIPFQKCGKLLVATNEQELDRMSALAERAARNGICVERLDTAGLRNREPNIVGLGALFVAETGIVDYKKVCECMRDIICSKGGTVELGTKVTKIEETALDVKIVAGTRNWTAKYLIACAGLQSDRIAKLAGLSIDHQIVPFRGEYYRLPASRNNIVNHLIYPIPDPELPFLGVHLTRMIDGSVTVGPNAVLGFAREGYPKFSFSLQDVSEYSLFSGFWRTIYRNFSSGMREMKNSIFKSGYLEECRKYCPSLTQADLLPYEAGIRAQAVMRDGTLVHDFLFEQTERMLHVCNAPSPAATSALPIAEMIASKVGTPQQ
ncbi:MAG TPA: L-2-hydroxyglutarate oxidase [Eoetvoesiella sp.]